MNLLPEPRDPPSKTNNVKGSLQLLLFHPMRPENSLGWLPDGLVLPFQAGDEEIEDGATLLRIAFDCRAVVVYGFSEVKRQKIARRRM